MPGLIDAHWHTMLVRPTPTALLVDDVGYLNLMAGAEATDTLVRGFTTVALLGSSYAMRVSRVIVAGPRIYPSGAIITVTGGHGDFRHPNELPRVLGAPLSRQELMGASMIADSPDEVRVRVREQLMQGASQIKLTAGGGVASPHSPLDVSTFTEAELRAAVEAAENWGTYVTVHAYTPVSIQRAIAAGVKCIDLGHLMDEPTAQLIAERGIWLSTQAFPDEIADAFPEVARARQGVRGVRGTDKTMALAKKSKLKTAFGTDILFSQRLAIARANCSSNLRVGIPLAKRSPWQLEPTANCWPCLGSVIRTRANLRHRTVRACRSSACGRRSHCRHQANRGPGKKPRCHL